MHHTPRRRDWLRAGLAGTLGWGLASPAARAQGAGEGLRIGYQKSAVNLMVARERRLLEARLPGVPLKWVEFPAGPQLLEALAVGGVPQEAADLLALAVHPELARELDRRDRGVVHAPRLRGQRPRPRRLRGDPAMSLRASPGRATRNPPRPG